MPACANMTDGLRERIRNAEMLFFDGTLWTDDEMIQSKVGVKTGKRMGHMSISGDDGTIAALGALNIKRKIFIHINTTNPVLLDDSAERAQANEAGWEVSYDGMHITV
jgi:pyrroloquinoline quinone biosynthesis protein B